MPKLIHFISIFSLEHNGDDVEYAMIVVDENNSTINDLDSPSMKVRLHRNCISCGIPYAIIKLIVFVYES